MPQSEEVPTFEATADGEAMSQFRAEIAAMSDEEVLTPRVDIVESAATAIGALREIEAQRAAIVARWGEAGGRTIDRLGPLARAVLTAHGDVITSTDRDLESMAAELTEVRTQLFLAASALVERKLVSKKSLADLVGGNGYQGRATDTIALARWFRTHAAKISGRTKVTAAELDRAEAMAQAFMRALAEREQGGAAFTRPARDRARIFTLFFRTYDRVRQLLTYVRWHEGDADEIAPSLFARGPRKPDGDVTDSGIDTSPGVVPPGLPGADPFTTP